MRVGGWGLCITLTFVFADSHCCKNGCVYGLSASEVLTTRDTVWAMTHKQQKKWLLAHFAAIYSHGTRQFTHTVCGKPVCLTACMVVCNQHIKEQVLQD